MVGFSQAERKDSAPLLGLMTFYLQSPAGDLATFQTIGDGAMLFACGRDCVEMTIVNARKVWKALLICQWQRVDQDAVLLWKGI